MELWRKRDATGLVLRKLKQALPASIPARTTLPEGWTPRAGMCVTVVSDGAVSVEQAVTRELVRITARAADLPRAYKIMAAIDALLTTPSTFLGLAVHPATRMQGGSDSKIGGFYYSATYTVAVSRRKV